MFQKPVCEGGYGALNCKKSKTVYIGITSEPRLSSVAGKTLKHISYFKSALDLRSWILGRAKYVKLLLGQSITSWYHLSLTEAYFSVIELILMYNSEKLKNKC